MAAYYVLRLVSFCGRFISAATFCLTETPSWTEVTNRVIHARRQHCLQEVGSKAGKAATKAEACQLAAEGLSTGHADIPFALIYLVEGEGKAREVRLYSIVSQVNRRDSMLT